MKDMEAFVSRKGNVATNVLLVSEGDTNIIFFLLLWIYLDKVYYLPLKIVIY